MKHLGNKGRNEELQSRRDFFKRVSTRTLPFLGAVVLGPAISLTTLTSCGCDSCEAACMDNCEGGCVGSCQGSATSTPCSDCSSSCSGSSTSPTCDNCANDCSSSCSGGATSSTCESCASDCSSSCKETCKNTCSTSCEGTAEGKVEISDASGSVNGYEYVDMGLSVNWARCNLGASKPEGYGKLYAFADPSGNNVYNGSTIDSYYQFGMFNRNGDSICGTQYDSARYKMGNLWRMPSKSEFEELLNNCDTEIYILNNIPGIKLISKKNGNVIFFPAAGNETYDGILNKRYELLGKNEDGLYWSGDVDYFSPGSAWMTAYAWDFHFETGKVWGLRAYDMSDKRSIRPVTTSSGGGGGGCTGSSCSSNCANNSTSSGCTGCSTGCSTSCKTTCEGSCINGCNTLCGGQCRYSCGGTCSYVSAGNSCTSSTCATTCSSYCYRTCTMACSSSCQSQCIYGSK